MSLLDWLSDGLGLGEKAGMGGGQLPPGMYPGGGQINMPPVQQTGADMPPPPVPAPDTEAMPGQRGNDMIPQVPSNMDPVAAGGVADSGSMDPMGAGAGAPPGSPPVPLPQPRPAGAPGLPPTDVSAASGAPGAPTNLLPPAAMTPAAVPPNGGTAKGILESALGLSPDRATRVRGSLGASLKAVGENANKSPLAALAGTAGSGIEGGTKSDEKQTDQRTKLLNTMISAQASGDRAAYTKALTAYTQQKLQNEQAKAADPGAAAKGGKSAMTEEQKLFKINDSLAKDPQIKAAQHILESTKRTGTPKEVAAAQKSFDDLFGKKKTEFTESLRSGSQTNPYKVTSQAELEKVAKPGDVYINPADGKPYVFKGAKKADTTTADASAATPAAQAGLPSPTKAANPDDDE